MEFPGLNGHEAIKNLVAYSGIRLSEDEESFASAAAIILSKRISAVLRAPDPPYNPATKHRPSPITNNDLRAFFRSAANLEREFPQEIIRRGLRIRIAQLIAIKMVVGKVPSRYDVERKDALGELFLLYARSQVALRKKSSLGLFLASQTFATMKKAMFYGSDRYYCEFEEYVVDKCLVKVPDSIDSEHHKSYHEHLVVVFAASLLTGFAFEAGAEWARTLHTSVARFLETRRDKGFQYDKRVYEEEDVETGVMKVLMLCLSLLRERCCYAGEDHYTQAGEGFLDSATITFAELTNLDLDAFENAYENNTLFTKQDKDTSSYCRATELVDDAFFEAWSLGVDMDGNIVIIHNQPNRGNVKGGKSARKKHSVDDEFDPSLTENGNKSRRLSIKQHHDVKRQKPKPKRKANPKRVVASKSETMLVPEAKTDDYLRVNAVDDEVRKNKEISFNHSAVEVIQRYEEEEESVEE